MEQNESSTLIENDVIRNSLFQIEKYLQKDILFLKKQLGDKSNQIKLIYEDLENAQHLLEGNQQLINKLLGDLSKLQNDLEWYKSTYEQRSFLGTIREKIFRKITKKKSKSK